MRVRPESCPRRRRDRRPCGLLEDVGTGGNVCGARTDVQRDRADSLRQLRELSSPDRGRPPRQGSGGQATSELASPKPLAEAGSADDPICVAGAPFSVLDYAAVRRYARAIASAVERRTMPPWLPEPGHGAFAGERRLTDDQIALIAKWVENGAPRGIPPTPKPPTFSGGWQLGTPDLVLTLPEPYVLQPGSRDVFRNFVVPVPITTQRYVRAEFRADRPQVLHHADLAIDLGRVSRARSCRAGSRIRDDGRRSGLQRTAGRPARFR